MPSAKVRLRAYAYMHMHIYAYNAYDTYMRMHICLLVQAINQAAKHTLRLPVSHIIM